jgi:hypothetical protein
VVNRPTRVLSVLSVTRRASYQTGMADCVAFLRSLLTLLPSPIEQLDRGSVSFVGYPLPRMIGRDLVFSLHWCASPWISRSAGFPASAAAQRLLSCLSVRPVATAGFRGLFKPVTTDSR